MSGKALPDARFSCPVIFWNEWEIFTGSKILVSGNFQASQVCHFGVHMVYIYIQSECRLFSAGTFPADVVLNRTRVGLPEQLATRFECNSGDRFWCLRGCNNFCIHFFGFLRESNLFLWFFNSTNCSSNYFDGNGSDFLRSLRTENSFCVRIQWIRSDE